MKKKFLSKIKEARLLSKEESKTISGGYGTGGSCGLPNCAYTFQQVALPNCLSNKTYLGQTHWNSVEYCSLP
ncbi:hypothetical protein [uncultured Aquimarina sp.]|uniref:hypothetical protein n=1 Tax=uncultured Aquimarina sp. TaxID=575652 RepID=UPI0026081F73|nr:hypothetical protein [uncultured Aquimarina sp.]